MFRSMNFFGLRRTSLRQRSRGTGTPESLEQRALLTVSAAFTSATGVLEVLGDEDANAIEVSADAAGNLQVNDGAISISGDVPTLLNTTQISIKGLGGDDILTLNEVNGVLPSGYLHGGEGNDYLSGSSNIDSLRGGSGADTLLGNLGNDSKLAQGGDDLIVWNNGDGSDFMEGGGGIDIVQVNGADAAGDDFFIDADSDRVRLARQNLGLFQLDIGTTETVNVNGQGGDDIIVGTNDLVGLTSLDLDGGEGNDELRGGGGDDYLAGGSGDDTLIGNRGNDIKRGEGGNDLLIWNNGDGSDLMEGGAGNDTLQVNGADGLGDDFAINPNGSRVAFARNNLGLFQLDIGTTESLDVFGLGGDDTIMGSTGLDGLISVAEYGGAGNDYLSGTDGVDQLFGGDGDDTLIGNLGNDIKLGQGGNDLTIWNNGDGSDLMEGGAGTDAVQVNGADAAGDDFLTTPNGARVQFERRNLGLFQLDIGTTESLEVDGEGGADTIGGSVGLDPLIGLTFNGGAGDDYLSGSDGQDVLNGGDGNDTLVGNLGNDSKYGDAGDDLIVWNNGDGSDLMEGGIGTDVVQVNGADAAGDDFAIDANGSRVRFQRNNLGLFQLDIGTTETLEVNGQGGDDAIIGTNELAGLIELDLDGGSGNDELRGGGGDDYLAGGDGDDTLIGNLGNDIKLGQGGNDLTIWNNGDGSDLMEGGAGTDAV
ncbi:MAG: calcium-binding protein, partial [Planctomycetaceae bacterium]